MKTLARQIKRIEPYAHKVGPIYERELQRLRPLNLKEREAKDRPVCEETGFRLRSYRNGLCAIFDEHRERFPQTLIKPDQVRIIAGRSNLDAPSIWRPRRMPYGSSEYLTIPLFGSV
jgi:hypothetical protein